MTVEGFVDYRKEHSPFNDAFAPFSVGYLESEVGLAALHPRSVISTYILADPTLRILLDGKPVLRKDLKCLPYATFEEAGSAEVSLRTSGTFTECGRFLYEITLTNLSAEPANVTLSAEGRGQGDHPTYLLAFFPGAKAGARELSVVADEVVEVSLCGSPGETDLPNVQLRLRCEGGDPSLSTGERNAFLVEFPTLELEPMAHWKIRMVLELVVGNIDAPPGLDFPETRRNLASRAAEWSNVFDGLPTGADGHAATRARMALMRSGLRGGAGEFGDSIASLCTGDRSDFSCSFFWDTLFTSVALSRFHPEFARGAIRTAFTRQLEEDGSSPERKWNYGVPQRMLQQSPQSPVASWAVDEYLKLHGDQEFLQEIYPRLVRNHRFWEVYSDTDRDGLSEYRWTGQVSDDSPLWDPYIIGGYTAAGCGWVPPVASVALNSFLYKDAHILAGLSRRLGRDDDSGRFLARKEAILRELFRICFVPEERRFWDYDHHIQQHRRVKTFWMFWPLYADMEVPQDAAIDLIENVLLDPAQFFGPIPFPSVAYDEPTYDPAGYWRGRTWPHISYWLLETLCKYGYLSEADAAADRLLEAWSSYPGFPENIASQLDLRAPGHLDYNWGCAAYLLTLERAYRLASQV